MREELGITVTASTGLVGAEALGGAWKLDEGGGPAALPPLTDRGMASYTGILATFSATTGTDNVVGDSASDTIIVTTTSQIQSSDIFSGGAGTDAIQIGAAASSPVTVDLSGAATDLVHGFLGIEALRFLNTTGLSSATLSAAQFGSGLIGPSLAVTGASGGTQKLIVNVPAAGTFDVSGWTFTGWTAGTDSLAINGSSGNDTLVLGATSPVSSADTYSGGAGIDTIQIGTTGNSGTSINFGAAATNGTAGLLGIEGLKFANRVKTSTATFAADQFGSGLVSTVLAVTGTSATQAVVVNLSAGGSINLSDWSFAAWSSGRDTITLNGSTGGETLIGSSQIDIFTGGTGADTITGGGGLDSFKAAVGDTALVIGGSGMAGTISGYDVITDFKSGASTATSEKISISKAGVPANTAGTDGANSSLQLHTGAVVASHAITNGIVTFSTANSFGGAVALTSLSDVAAAVQYLRSQDFGNAGASLAFTATIAGVAHSYVYAQGGNSGNTANDLLFDLRNLSATALSASSGKLSVLDAIAPGAPALTIPENAGGGINASEAADGTVVTVSLSGTGAIAGDTLTLAWGTQSILYTLTADDILGGSATVTVSAGTIAAQGDGAFDVTAKLTDGAGNIGATASAVAVVIDRSAPSVTIDIDDTTLNVGDGSATVTFTFSEAPVGFTLGDIAAAGGTVSGLALTADPLVYTASFTAAAGFTGTGAISLAAGSYTDAVLNPGGAGSDTVAIDRVSPTVTIDILGGALRDGDATATVTFTFSEAPVGFTAGDIAALGGTISGLEATADPLAFTATFTAEDGHTGTGTVSLASGSYADAALNPGGAGSDAVAIDRANPGVAVNVAGATLNDSDASVIVTFTFSEAPVGFGADDVVAVGGVVTGLAATADPLVYTAAFTADDGFAGTGSVSVAAGSYADAAGNVGGAGADTVVIDRANQGLVVAILGSALSDADSSTEVTFTFGEAPVGFTLDSITALGGTVSGLAATADPRVYTATFTATDGFAGAGSVSVAAGSYTDAAGNPGEPALDIVAIDRANATVALDIVDGTLSDGDTRSTVTVTFSEAPVDFGLDDITAIGGTVSGLTATADPLVYTATFTAEDGFSGTASVALAAGSYTDMMLNPGGPGADTVAVDRANPTVTVDIAGTALSDGNVSSLVTFTFSEVPASFTLADITAVGGVVSDLAATADPLVYTATFTATDGFGGTGLASVTAGGYTDTALNAGGAGSDRVAVDRVNPTVTIGIADGVLSDTVSSATVTFTFSEAPVGFALGDITAVGGTVSGLAATANPLVYTATLTATDGFSGAGAISVTAGSYTDAALNAGDGGAGAVTIDRANPTVSVDIVDDALSDADSSSEVTFTFSEVPVGFAPDDIIAVGGTVSGLSATADPLVYTATFTATDGFAGTGTIAVVAGSYTDTALNGGGAASDAVSVDRANQGLVIDIVQDALSDGSSGSTVTFTFNRAPVGFTLADIAALGGAVSGLAVTGDPTVYTATFTATDGFAGTGSVSVAAGSYTDTANNPGEPASDVVDIDRANPTVTVDIANGTLSDGEVGAALIFTFSEAPVGFEASDITAIGGTVSSLTATVDPLVYTATFTAMDGFAGTGSVSVATGSYTDDASNLGVAGSDTTTIDRANPGAVVHIVRGTLNDGNASSAVTFTFSEAPVGFTLADVIAVGGAVTGLSATADPLVYTATFTATDGFNGTGSVAVAASSYADAALNAGSAASDTVSIDRAKPVVTVDIAGGALSDGNVGSAVTFTFTEAPTGFALDDITAVGGTVSGLTVTGDAHVYTATFTATDGFAGTGSVSVAVGSYTDAALNPGDPGSDAVTIDRANPTVAVDIAAGALSGSDAASTVTFTFSEAPTGFTLADIAAVGGTVSHLAVTADQLVYAATFTATDGFSGEGSVSVAAGGYTDAALNAGGPGSDTVVIDRTSPTLTVNIAADTLSDVSASSTVTFIFSEAPAGFALNDITAVGGVISDLAATADPLVYTAIFMATDGFAGTGSVAVAAGSFTDAALNPGAAGSDTVTIDRANPAVTANIVDATLSDASASALVTFTFSEAPVGFTLADVTVVGGVVTGLSATADPLIYTATFTAEDGFNGTGSVAVAAGSYTDAALNAGGAESATVAIDRANPAVVADIVGGALSDGDPSSLVTFTFSEAPVGFTLGDITAVGGTVGGLTVTADPLVYTAIFTATDGFSGAGSVSVAAGSYTDAALNAGASASDAVAIDRAGPTVTVDIAGGTLSDGDTSRTVTFTFNEAPTGFGLEDITVAGGVVSDLVATADPLVYTASFTATDGFAGTGSVSVAAGSYTDMALNLGDSGSTTLTIDRANPAVTVDIVDGALSDGSASSLVTFTFSEAPAGFALDDVTVLGGVVSDLAVTADPLVYTATFTAGDGFSGAGSVSVGAGSYTDTALNAGSAASDSVVIDRENPTVAVEFADSALSDGGAVSLVTFTFSEAPGGFTLGDITAVGGTVSGLAVTADPLVYTATFTAIDGFSGAGSVSVAAGSYTDAALNAGGPGADSVTIDRQNPTVTVDIAAGTLSDGASVSLVTFTFSETPDGFTLDDIAALGGVVSDLAATADPLVYTATFTATDGFAGTGSVTVAAGSYTDALLNAGASGSDTVAIDRENPAVTVDLASAALSDGESGSTVTFTFSKAPVGFTLADITAVGGTISDLVATADPLVYRAIFTAEDGFAGTGTVSVATGSYTDAALNAGSAASESVVIDRDDPTVAVDIANGVLGRGHASATVTFSFSEAPVGFTLADITAVGGTVSDLAATADPLVYTATFTADDGVDGTGSVTVAAGSYGDAASNAGSAGADTVTIDTVGPTVSVDIADIALSDGDADATVTFTFSEAPIGFEAADIAALGGSISGLTATSDPLVYTATFTADDGFGGGGAVSVSAGSYTDAALNQGGPASDTVAIDRDNPTVAVDIADSVLNDGDPASLVTFTFSEAPPTFTLGDISAVGGTVGGLAATSDPLVYTATFTANDGFSGVGSVAVAAGSYTDLALNPGEAGADAVTIDRTNAGLAIDIVASGLSDADPSSTVTFTFSEAPVGFGADDITAVGGALSGLAATADPLVYTATFTASDGFASTGSVAVAAGSYTNAALNPGEPASDVVAIDRANPAVTVDIVDGMLSDGDSSSEVSFTFTEAPTGFALDDLVVIGGTVSGLAATADPLVYTASFTAADGFGDPASVSVLDGSYADTAANVGAAGSDTVLVDRENPTVTVDITAGALSDAAPASTVTFAFSEAPVGFTLDGIAVLGGTVSDLAATTDPLVYTAIFTADDDLAGSGSVSVTAGSYADASLNAGESGSDTVTIDRTNPSVAVDVVDSALNDGDSRSTVTFTFSEVPDGFGADDITAVGGTVSDLIATADPLVFTAVFIADDGFDGTGSVSVAANSYADAAGNAGGPAGDSVAIDRAGPAVMVDIASDALSDGDLGSIVTFTFSEAPVGFTLDDIAAVGGTIADLAATDDPLVYTARFTADDGFSGTGSVAVKAGSYADAAENAGAAASDTAAIDRANPTVTVDILDDALSNADGDSIVTFTFSEAPVGFGGNDIVVAGGTLSDLAVTADPLVYTAVFTAEDGFSADGSVAVVAGSYTDASLNAGGSSADTVAIDRARPVVTVDIAGGTLSDGDPSSVVTFTFSEAPAGFTLDDIAALGGAVSGLTATADPLVYTATFTATDGFTGTGSVTVATGSYTDAALNPGDTGTAAVTIDRANPTVAVDIAEDALSGAVGSTTVIFTFSEAPVGFTLDDVTVLGGALSDLAATADPLVYTATFTATDGFSGTGSVTVAAGSYTDTALNEGGSGLDTAAVDREQPTVSVDIARTALSDGTPAATVTFTFSEAPDGFSAADIAAVGGTVGGLTATADPLVYTATFTAEDGFSGTGSVAVLAGSYTDAALNAGGAASDAVAIDRTNPDVIIDVSSGTLNDGDSRATVTFTFSETPDGFDLADIVAVGGTVSDLATTADPLIYTATFAASDGFDGVGSVTIAAGSYADGALNVGAAGSAAVPIDRANPTVAVEIAEDALSDSNPGSTVTLTFSEAPVGFTLGDIAAVGGTVSDLIGTADPLVYTATFVAADGFAGTGSVSVAPGSYTDADLNAGDPGSDTLTIDREHPTISVEIAGTTLDDGDPDATVTFTFSEAPVGFSASDIVAVGGTLSGLAATADPLVLTATFSAEAGFSGTGSISVLAGSYTDAALNAGSAGSDVVAIDRTADASGDLTLSITDTAINAVERTKVAFTTSGMDADVVRATVTFTDSIGKTVTVAVSAGFADLSSLLSGAIDTRLDITDLVGNTVSVAGASLALDKVKGSDDNDTITGTALADAFDGLGGNDSLLGLGGSDSLNGGVGNDRLSGGAGADSLEGGSGNDLYYVDSAADRVAEASGGGVDTVYASASYTLAAGQAIENLRANAGSTGLALTGNELNNSVMGLSGDDTLNGGHGNDRLNGSTGDDRLVGGLGSDRYYVDSAADQVIEATGGGTDFVYASVGYTLAASQAIERLLANAGTTGLALTGNKLSNIIAGAAGNDTLDGGDGDDRLNGGIGDDLLAGGSGNDRYYVDSAADRLSEATGDGTDFVYAIVDYTLAAGQAVERLIADADATGLMLTGNELNNVLGGAAGNDSLNGGAGNDRLDGGSGNDVVSGGGGNDRYYVDSAADQVIEAAGGGNDIVYASVGYTLAAGQAIERLLANAGATGLALTGNERNNTLMGAAGNDTLGGGGGNDSLQGAGGNDVFEFGTPLLGSNFATIADFTHGADRIALSASVYTEAGAVGSLASTAFHIGAAAHDADDRVIYDVADGGLMYDPDGIGVQAATKFATLTPGLTLAASDIVIF